MPRRQAFRRHPLVDMLRFPATTDTAGPTTDPGPGLPTIGPRPGVPAAAPTTGPGPGVPAELVAALDAPPGPQVAAVLSSVEPADLPEGQLVEALAAWERLAAWAQAGSARVLAELLDRAAGSARVEFVVDEVSARLGLSRAAAEQHLTVAAGGAAIPEVADLMSAGLVDRRKAEALVATGRMDDSVRRRAVRCLADQVEHLTVRQIKDRLRRAEIAEDPEGADRRHRRARRDRYVALEPVDNQMAFLTAYLSADDATRAFAAVSGLADQVHRTPGEERPLGACRADAFVGILTGTLTAARPGTGSPAGSGPLAAPAKVAVPAVVTTPNATTPIVTAPVFTTPIITNPIRVTIAASTLLGADDGPADLAGYGPISASLARAMAADPDATWQRIWTDPGTGTLTDTGTRRYRPGRALRAAVVARDVTCAFPGCAVPAQVCDLDHISPYDPDADHLQTHADNLQPLCRHQHRAKTLGGWTVRRDPTSGVTSWTSPGGGDYRRDPRPADPAWRPPEGSHPPDHGGSADRDDPPSGNESTGDNESTGGSPPTGHPGNPPPF